MWRICGGSGSKKKSPAHSAPEILHWFILFQA
jgi:hypothetical protein